MFLTNRETGRAVPVDPGSLSEDDRDRIGESGYSLDVEFDYRRHVRHRFNCKDPGYDPKRKA